MTYIRGKTMMIICYTIYGYLCVLKDRNENEMPRIFILGISKKRPDVTKGKNVKNDEPENNNRTSS